MDDFNVRLVFIALFWCAAAALALRFFFRFRLAPRVWKNFAKRNDGLRWSKPQLHDPSAGILEGEFEGWDVFMSQGTATGAAMTRGPTYLQVPIAPPLKIPLAIVPDGPDTDHFACYSLDAGPRVYTGDASFDAAFAVHCHDPLYAGQVMTHALREALLNFAQTHGHVALSDNRLVQRRFHPPLKTHAIRNWMRPNIGLARVLSETSSVLEE